MHLIDQIRAKRDEIYAIARKHKAERLWVFGSVARREERHDRDAHHRLGLGGLIVDELKECNLYAAD